MRVAFMGPAHTFSEQAALALAPGGTLRHRPSITALFSALAEGGTDAAVVPMENSQVGAVPETVDRLLALDRPLGVLAETTLSIRFAFYVRAAGPAPDRIASHMMSFRQCAPWVAARGLPTEEVGSTGDAVARAASGAEPGLAAIGPAGLDVPGLVEAERDLQGPRAFDTRFLLLAPASPSVAARAIVAVADLARLPVGRARAVAVRATGDVGRSEAVIEAEGGPDWPGRPLLLWR